MIKQFSTFFIQNQRYAIEIDFIREIKRGLRVTQVDHAPSYIRGLINLRGLIITAFDPADRMDLPKKELNEESMFIILKTDAELSEDKKMHGNLNGENIGLCCDSIGDVLDIDEKDLQPVPPNMTSSKSRYASNVIATNDSSITICLDIASLLTLDTTLVEK